MDLQAAYIAGCFIKCSAPFQASWSSRFWVLNSRFVAYKIMKVVSTAYVGGFMQIWKGAKLVAW